MQGCNLGRRQHRWAAKALLVLLYTFLPACVPTHELTPTPTPAGTGIYVFKKRALTELLDSGKTSSKFMDFGGEIIPYAAANGRTVKVRAAQKAPAGGGARRCPLESPAAGISGDAPRLQQPQMPLSLADCMLAPARRARSTPRRCRTPSPTRTPSALQPLPLTPGLDR